MARGTTHMHLYQHMASRVLYPDLNVPPIRVACALWYMYDVYRAACDGVEFGEW